MDAPLAFSVNATPTQAVVGPLITGAVGYGFTVTICVALLEQLLLFVPVNVYVPDVDAVIDDAVDPPGFHEKLSPGSEFEFNTTDPPWQNVVGPPARIFTTGNPFTVTFVVMEQPLLFV